MNSRAKSCGDRLSWQTLANGVVKLSLIFLNILFLLAAAPGEVFGGTVKIIGSSTYGSFQTAYANATTGAILQSQSINYSEGLILNRSIDIIVHGGYDPNDLTFSTLNGVTTINGPLIVRSGSIIVENLSIAGSNVLASVPNVVGQNEAAAQVALLAAGLDVGIVSLQNSAIVTTGAVISQSPVAAATTPLGTPVDLIVSTGPVMVTVPDVVGLNQANAQAAILAANLIIGTVTQVGSDTVPTGSVISQYPPAGASAAIGSAVTFVMSLGSQRVPVPNIAGMTEANAQASILAANLTVGTVIQVGSDTVPAGSVISQNPPADTSVLLNSPVSFLVSLGVITRKTQKLSITGMQLVSESLISGTLFEYTYRLTVKNEESVDMKVEGETIGVSPNFEVITPLVRVGTVPAGGLAESLDVFVVRHDQAFQLQLQDLTWIVWGIDSNFNGLLLGPGSGPAIAATMNIVDNPPQWEESQVSVDSNGMRVLRTELVVEIAAVATVAQINQALTGVNGQITGMLEGSSFLIVTIPDPGSLAALGTIQQQLAASPGIRLVRFSTMASLFIIPDNPSYNYAHSTQYNPIGHHLAIRAHATWNAKDLFKATWESSKSPLLVLIDLFGHGPPDATKGFSLRFNSRDYGINVPAAANIFHGYTVLSQIGASFGGDNTNIGLATGIMPQKNIEVKAFDLWKMSFAQAELRTVFHITRRRMENPTKTIILNTSYGEGWGNCAAAPCWSDINIADAKVKAEAQRWESLLRQAILGEPLVTQFLHFTAAGNNRDLSAIHNSGFNYAALHGSVDNILVVGGRLGVDGSSDSAPTRSIFTWCSWTPDVDVFSPGGHISAIGAMMKLDTSNALWPLGGVGGVFDPFKNGSPYSWGSSYASPQAAGVAAMVWSAKPVLTVSDIKNIFLKTSDGNVPYAYPGGTACNSDVVFKPPIDAYAAVLAADNPYGTKDLGKEPLRDANNNINAPVRLALLDVAHADSGGNLVDGPDGKFDQADIMKFLQEFEKRKGAVDYSRYDLNGDGRTGEPYPATGPNTRFDLDGNYKYDAGAEQTVEGNKVLFDELTPADITILMYYAYSPLYIGSELERAMLLVPYLEKFNSTILKLDSLVLNYHKSVSYYYPFGPYSLYPPPATPGIMNAISYPNGVTGYALVLPCPLSDVGTPKYGETVNNQAAALSIAPYRWDGGQVGDWWLNSSMVPYTTDVHAGCPAEGFFATIPSTGKFWAKPVWNISGPTSGFLSTYPNQTLWDFQQQRRVYFGEPDLLAGHAGGFVFSSRRLNTFTDQWGITGNIPITENPPYTVGSYPEFWEIEDLKNTYGVSSSNVPGVTIKVVPK